MPRRDMTTGRWLSTAAEVRFWADVDKAGPLACWTWRGPMGRRGYGRFTVRWDATNKRNVRAQAHRYAYEMLVGPIAAGLHLDHLCMNPACVNPAHMEPVPPRENILRSHGPSALNARAISCVSGHSLDGDNLYITPNGRRQCRACRAAAARRHYARKVSRVA